MNVADEIAKLAQLRDQGVLNEAEFQQQKQTVLAKSSSAEPVASSPVIRAKKSAGAFKIGCFAILGIIALLVVIGAFANKAGIGGGSKAADSVAGATPPIEVTAIELFNAFHANEPAAQNRFGDHPLLVSGTIDSVDLDFKNDAVLKLKTPNEFMSAQAALTDAAKPKASSLHKGDQVKLLCGNVKLIIGTPMLSDCEPQ